MGVSIDAGIYTFDQVVTAIEEKNPNLEGKLAPRELLNKIVPLFGRIVPGTNDMFVLVHNEYYEEYNPALEFMSFIERYYDIDSFYVFGLGITGGANANEVARELDIKLSDSVDY